MLATSATDVSTTLLFCQKYSIDLATRGGGHSSSGASSSEGGIVIDLSGMRNVTVNPVDKTITAQGGCLWEDVDKAAGQHGLATVGGTVNHTGIGGLTLGGGYGWLCGQHGLTIDNLLSVKIVLANGDIVRSSESENTDLFWGIRGAGQSLGVVTEFTYRAHDQPNPVWAGQLLFTPDKLESVIEFGNHIAAVSKGEAAAMMGFCAPPPVHAPLVLAIVFYNGTEEQALEFYKPLLDASPVVNMVSIIPYRSLNTLLNPIAGHGGRKVNKGAAYAHPVRPTFFRSLYDDFSTFLTEVPDAAGSMLAFEIYVPDKICQVSNTAMAFANRGSYGNSLILSQWGQKENDAACRAWTRVMAEKFKGEMERGKREGDVRLLVEGVGEYLNTDSEFFFFIYFVLWFGTVDRLMVLVRRSWAVWEGCVWAEL